MPAASARSAAAMLPRSSWNHIALIPAAMVSSTTASRYSPRRKTSTNPTLASLGMSTSRSYERSPSTIAPRSAGLTGITRYPCARRVRETELLGRDRDGPAGPMPLRDPAQRARRRPVARLFPALASHRAPQRRDLAGGRARGRAARLLRDAGRPPRGHSGRACRRRPERAALPAAERALAHRVLAAALRHTSRVAGP